MATSRVIFHIDMNCYFVSCEVAENPALEGQKVAIAHKSIDKKGMVLSCSYEARKYGIKATMPLFEAYKRCPDLIAINPNMELYKRYSRMFFDYLLKISPLLEIGSIDEGYLDVTEAGKTIGYVELATKIQSDLLNLYHLPCSIGIGPNKFLAKMGSDYKKPLGITVIRKKDVEKILWPLPIEDMFGCGKKTCEMLKAIGINTIGDIVNFKDQELLKSMCKEQGYKYLIYHANGGGDSVVDPNRYGNVSSISNAHTFDHDVYNTGAMLSQIKKMAYQLSKRLIDDHLKAMTFTLQIKYNNFKAYSRSITLQIAINEPDKMYETYKEIFEDLFDDSLGVRLLSVACSKLQDVKEEFKQLTIFDALDNENKDLEVTRALKKINDFFGKDVVIKGVKEDYND